MLIKQTKNPADDSSRAGEEQHLNKLSIDNILPFSGNNCKNQRTRIMLKCYRYGHKFIPDFIKGGGLCG